LQRSFVLDEQGVSRPLITMDLMFSTQRNERTNERTNERRNPSSAQSIEKLNDGRERGNNSSRFGYKIGVNNEDATAVIYNGWHTRRMLVGAVHHLKTRKNELQLTIFWKKECCEV
jgi:hypothetical protein